jgi:hypothetical protein
MAAAIPFSSASNTNAVSKTAGTSSSRTYFVWLVVFLVVASNLANDLGDWFPVDVAPSSFTNPVSASWSSTDVSSNTTTTIGSSNQSTKLDSVQPLHTTATNNAETTNETLPELQLPAACAGKEHLANILLAARLYVTEEDCWKLPTWQQVVDLYGPEPIIHGLETCQQYQSHIAQLRQAADSNNHNDNLILPKPRVAGFCNTGTNALAKTLRKNLGQQYANERKYSITNFDVPWGKHHRVTDRNHDNNKKNKKKQHKKNRAEDSRGILPVILIRDPYRWMSSMCKMRYIVDLPRGESCWHVMAQENETLKTRYETGTVSYESLPDLWNRWNREYYDYNYEEHDGTTSLRARSNTTDATSTITTTYFPRLVIRYEDLVFHAATVVDQILNCAGIAPKDRKRGDPTASGGVGGFVYQTAKAKSHGVSVDLVQAMIKYGTRTGRKDEKFRPVDLDYIRQTLDSELMTRFGYPYE